MGKVLVEHYDKAVALTIDGKGYSMAKKLWEETAKPALIALGYEIEEVEAPEEEKAKIRALAAEIQSKLGEEGCNSYPMSNAGR